MNLNFLYAILGIIATIAIGYWGIRLTLKTRRNVSLSFAEIEYIPLFKTIIKNFDSLEIKYKSQPITEELVLIKTSLVNDGNMDIDKSMIYKPVTISLPQNFKCIELTPTEKSEKVNPTITFVDNEIVITWDLLKKDEYISFDLLVEIGIDKDQNISSKVTNLKYYNIGHRITNLNQINKYKIDLIEIDKSSSDYQFKKRFLPFIVLLLGLTLIIATLFDPNTKFSISYFIKTGGIKKELLIVPKSLTEIEFISNIDSLNFTMPITQLKEKYDINFGIERRRPFDIYSLFGLGMILFVLGLWVFISQIKPEREKTIRKLLKTKT